MYRDLAGPLPLAPGAIKTALGFSVGTDASVSSHFFWQTSSSGITTAQLTTLAGDIAGAYSTDLAQLATGYVHLHQVEATDLSTAATAPGLWAGDHAGTNSNDPLAASTAALFNLKIARRYRGGHPRLYMPFGWQGALTGPQTWTNAFIASANTQMAAFVAAIIGSGGGAPTITSLANVSYRTGKSYRATALVEPVSSFPLNPIPGTQRRRMGR